MAASGMIGVSGLAERYATALYGLAEDEGALDRTVEEVAAIRHLIEANKDTRRLVEDRALAVADVARALDAGLESEGVSALVRRFVGVVIANRRLRDLPGILAGFAAYVAARRGVVVARVASAHALTDIQRMQLRARLTEAGYGQVELHESVEPGLLGGLTVQIGSRLYDTSLKSRLQRLHYAMRRPEPAPTKGVA